MPADAFWTLAMAVNVYLTFYYKYDAVKLRKMEIPYLLTCYGIPFIVALVELFISTPDKGRMYGNAVLWCWVSSKWDIFRIVTFYGPVWIVILVTFFIYIRAGGDIYRKRQQLKNFSSHHEPEPLPVVGNPFGSSKTTEVYVTSEIVSGPAGDVRVAPRRDSEAASPRAPNAPAAAAAAAYSVTISSTQRAAARDSYGDVDVGLPIQTNVALSPATDKEFRAAAPAPNRRRQAYDSNNAAWSYTKCALLFFTALLVTWIPSSANRVFSVVHANEVSLPLEFMSSLVLPLQGFWNALIYIVTSWSACKTLFGDIMACAPKARRPNATNFLDTAFSPRISNFRMMSSGRNGSKTSAQTSETESMEELANVRPMDKKSPY
jgi:hypothetical protein